jgi:hypothetical protein
MIKMKNSKWFYLLIVTAFLSFTSTLFSQSYYDSFDGIPIIQFAWASNFYDGSYPHIGEYNFNNMKEMGADMFMGTHVLVSQFNKAKDANLKIFPMQEDKNIPHYITRYTEASYTLWEAEGEGPDPYNEYATMKSDPDNLGLTELYYENSTVTGIATKSNSLLQHNSGLILNGPGYSQSVRYIDTTEDRDYKALFKLKLIEDDPHSNPPLENDDRIICKIRVRGRSVDNFHHLFDSLDIKIKDLSTSTWTSKELSYDFRNLPAEAYTEIPSPEDTLIFFRNASKVIKMIDFEVFWYKTENYRLAVNNVLVYDNRGEEFLVSFTNLENIRKQILNQHPLLIFPEGDFDNVIAGWYGVDEPMFIDQMEPIRKMDSLIRTLTNDKMKLLITLAGCWDGTYNGYTLAPGHIKPFKEFKKRCNLNGWGINWYPFRLPISEMSLGLHKIELNYMNENNLQSYGKLDPNFFFMVQNGRWIANNSNIQLTPTRQQYNYLINNALLFGVKGISIMNYFAGIGDSIGGMYNHFDPVVERYRDLYFYTKDTISPRLKGLYGKTLKAVQTDTQYIWLTFNDLANQHKYIESITPNALENLLDAGPEYDLGFFTKGTEEYFMLLNRWYNGELSYDINIKVDKVNSGYNNWKIVNYIDTSSFTISNNGTFPLALDPGDARLFGLFPVVHYGGDLIYDEVITGTNTLHEAMTIKSGAKLTVNGTYNIYGDITVEAGAQLDIKPGAKLNFFNNSRLIVNSNFYAVGAPGNKIEFNFNGSGK